MRKIISLILCTLLVCLTLMQSMGGQAANSPTISCESVTCNSGEQITVDVMISSNPGFSYLELTPQYDSALTLVKVENGDLISDFTKGKQYVWVADEDVTRNGLLMTFTFQVAENVAAGDYPVNFVVRTCGNYNEEPVNFAVQRGIVTVQKKTQTPGTITCQNVTCNSGEQITVDVMISNNPGFSYLELTPQYDSALTLVKVENGDLISDFTKGKQYVWVADEDVTRNGLLMTFTFQVAENVAAGDYPVNFVVRTCGNYNEEPVNFAVQRGIVTVQKKTQTPGTITCQNVTCNSGEQITVDVMISNNPGFSYLELTPQYDSALTLVKVENGDLISDFTKGKQYVWVSDEDVTQNGLLMSFTFDVGEDVVPGAYSVAFIVRTCGNYNEEPVNFAVQTGTVTVQEKPIPVIDGDLDDDGKVSNKDVEYLLWYTLFPEEFSVNQDADYDGDGHIDNKDVEYLLWHTLFPEDYPLTTT